MFPKRSLQVPSVDCEMVNAHGTPAERTRPPEGIQRETEMFKQ